jgi:hypothetical protein
MSNTPAASGGTKSLKLAFTLVIILAVCVGVWLGLVSGTAAAFAKYMADRTDPSSLFYTFPKWIQPNKKWHDWVGYPETFSNIAGFIPTSSSIVAQNSSVKDVTADTDCMLKCAADTTCKGFLYSKTANTCTLYTSFSGLFSTDTSNVVYSVVGSEPTQQYTLNTGKIPPAFPSVALTSGLTIGSTDIKITNIICSNGTCTATTPVPHNLTTTSTITIYNYGGGGAPATLPLTGLAVPSTTTFTFPPTGSISGSIVNSYTYLSSSTTPVTAADTITFVASAAHGYAEGQTVKISGGTPSLASTFANTFTISKINDATTFSVTLSPPSTLGQNLVGGTAQQVSSIKTFTDATPIKCAQACSSNTACVAFIFDTTAKVCGPQSAVPSGTMVTTSGVDTYTISVPTFTASNEYWGST